MNHLFKCSFFQLGCPLILALLLVIRNLATFVFENMSETILPKTSFSKKKSRFVVGRPIGNRDRGGEGAGRAIALPLF